MISTARKRRLVLAALLARAGQPVPVDTLVEAVWAERPPASARRNLQLYVHELRRMLGDDSITTRGDGYLLDPGSGLDSIQFRRLVGEGSTALDAGDPVTAETTLRTALDLWRGPAFAEFLDSRLIADEAQALELLRLDSYERWAEAQLTTGATPRLATELAELCRLYPYRETLRASLMRALYHTGRQAEALAVFREARTLLADQLGVEPGRELQRLHQAMLRGDATPTLAARAETPPAMASTVPRELPPDPAVFTGRGEALGLLDESLPGPDGVARPVVICGLAGVGKTTLAVRWAHQVSDRFPDGQLYVNLRGFAPGAPVRPLEALERLLGSLGVPAGQVSSDLDTATAMFRTRVAGRRILLVLDNARDAEQVRPLLPAAPSCLTLVTSRDRLTGLVARDGARQLSLDVLDLAGATTLIGQLAPDHGDPQAAADLAQACGYLPLAIRIAVAHLADRPGLSIADYAAILRSGSGLDGMEIGGDPEASVRAAFAHSYHALDPAAQRLFRLLGLLPGPDVTPLAAAALADTNQAEAQRLLNTLARAHLVNPGQPGRYALHDLLRAYAGELAIGVDAADREAEAASDRLLDYYRHAASLAMDTAYPHERGDRPQVPPARTPVPDHSDPAPALVWLDTELPNLLAAAGFAAEHGRPALILHLSAILHRHLRTRGRYHDAETLHQQALTSARASGNQAGELAAWTGLGHVHLRQTRYAQAIDDFGQAMKIAHATGDLAGEMEPLTGLGRIHRMQSRYAQAAEHYQRAFQLARATGHRVAEVNALTGLGDVHMETGRFAQATEHYQQALQLARATGHRVAELPTLAGLGEVHRQQGLYAQATDYYLRALRLARTSGNRAGELNALSGLAQLQRRQGQYAESADHYRQMLDLALRIGERNFEFEAQQGLGRLQHAIGRPDLAITHHERALALAGDLDQPIDQARAQDGLAHAHRALNQPENARRHWRHALDILTNLGLDHTPDEEATVAAIRNHLAGRDKQRQTTGSSISSSSQPRPGPQPA